MNMDIKHRRRLPNNYRGNNDRYTVSCSREISAIQEVFVWVMTG